MKAFCLIATKNRPSLPKAVASASEWRVIVQHDAKDEGAGAVRNKLIDQALNEGADFIRFADDDDRVCAGSVGDILAPFADPSVDAVAHDMVVIRSDGRCWRVTPSASDEIFVRNQAYVCNGVWRASSLWRLAPAFREDIRCRLGGWLWLKTLAAGMKVARVPVAGYVYLRNSRRKSLSDLAEFESRNAEFMEAVDKFYGH